MQTPSLVVGDDDSDVDDGKTKRITSKQCPELFNKLNAILKKAEKEGALWNEQMLKKNEDG